VVIVGAGLTGLTAAALLSEAGQRVAVLEARRIGSGVTGGTTAHLTAVLDTRFHALAAHFGESGAALAARSHQQAIAQVRTLMRQHGIDCDYRTVPGYLYAEAEEQVEEVEREAEALRRAGLSAALVPDPGLPFPVQRAVRIDDQGQFHPLKYLYGLARMLQQRGVALYEQSPVRRIEDNEDGVRIETEYGSLDARAVFMATHIPPGINLVDTLVAPYRSYVLACSVTEPVPQGLYWDTAEPYHYTRTQTEQEQTWLIVGGKDHKTGEETDTDSRFEQLELYARAHFPVDSVAYRWSAQVYEPVDGLAYIGRSPGANHYYYATGYAGNGMTYANVAARLVSDLILGRANPYADLYSPARFKPLASAADFLRENASVVAHRIGDYLRTDAETLDDVAPGEGKVVAWGDDQVAAYRDASGHLHTLSPVCTHLGCRVHWNGAEKTWDCPCHGGRFSATGDWLEGPPMHPLERVEVTEAETETGGGIQNRG
jgi:glycine/D-amino acid oxidase-like deaminating enzyme/nitrite reductase/ring-hydroxylating ferredoxin subunit